MHEGKIQLNIDIGEFGLILEGLSHLERSYREELANQEVNDLDEDEICTFEAGIELVVEMTNKYEAKYPEFI